MNQIEQIDFECFRQGLPDEEVKIIIDFCKRKNIPRINNVTNFVTAWRINPVRRKIQLVKQARKAEAAVIAERKQYESALHQTIKAFQIMGGKLPELNKVKHLGLSAMQKEQKRQQIQKQLGI